jgi:hypothetical protein
MIITSLCFAMEEVGEYRQNPQNKELIPYQQLSFSEIECKEETEFTPGLKIIIANSYKLLTLQ